MRLYPAVDVASPSSLDDVLVAVDDFSPTAVEERDGAGVRLFFASRDARNAACAALRDSGYHTRPLDVDDEDWARRSQEGLQPISVGRITIFPGPHSTIDLGLSTPDYRLVILPSMGFGTGHHATTRFCLAALQELPVTGAFVLDVGTGSGVLAIAAARLGAARALGIDVDPDAIQAARENLALNPEARGVAFEVDDVAQARHPDIASGRADVVTANLTGALLTRIAPLLARSAHSGGWLILSGILIGERDAVLGAFGRDVELVREDADGEWVALTMKRR